MNRIKHYFARAPDSGPPERYFTVETRSEAIPVTHGVAERLRAQVTRFWKPRYVSFRDIAGARHTLRTAEIYMIRESSAEIRAAVRAFFRARERERDEDTSEW